MSDTMAGSSPYDEAAIERLACLMQMKDDAKKAFIEAEKRKEEGEEGAELYTLVGSLKSQALELIKKEIKSLQAGIPGVQQLSAAVIYTEAEERSKQRQQEQQQEQQNQAAEDTKVTIQLKSPAASGTALVSDDGSATETDAASAGLLGQNLNGDNAADAVSPMTVDTFDPEKEALKNEVTTMKRKEVIMQRDMATMTKKMTAMKKKMESMQSSGGISQEAQSRMAQLRGETVRATGDDDGGSGEEEGRDIGDNEAGGDGNEGWTQDESDRNDDNKEREATRKTKSNAALSESEATAIPSALKGTGAHGTPSTDAFVSPNSVGSKKVEVSTPSTTVAGPPTPQTSTPTIRSDSAEVESCPLNETNEGGTTDPALSTQEAPSLVSADQNTVAQECAFSSLGCCKWMGQDLFQCQNKHCNESIHHLCGVDYATQNNLEEGPGGEKKLCPIHLGDWYTLPPGFEPPTSMAIKQLRATLKEEYEAELAKANAEAAEKMKKEVARAKADAAEKMKQEVERVKADATEKMKKEIERAKANASALAKTEANEAAERAAQDFQAKLDQEKAAFEVKRKELEEAKIALLQAKTIHPDLRSDNPTPGTDTSSPDGLSSNNPSGASVINDEIDRIITSIGCTEEKDKKSIEKMLLYTKEKTIWGQLDLKRYQATDAIRSTLRALKKEADEINLQPKDQDVKPIFHVFKYPFLLSAIEKVRLIIVDQNIFTQFSPFLRDFFSLSLCREVFFANQIIILSHKASKLEKLKKQYAKLPIRRDATLDQVFEKCGNEIDEPTDQEITPADNASIKAAETENNAMLCAAADTIAADYKGNATNTNMEKFFQMRDSASFCQHLTALEITINVLDSTKLSEISDERADAAHALATKICANFGKDITVAEVIRAFLIPNHKARRIEAIEAIVDIMEDVRFMVSKFKVSGSAHAFATEKCGGASSSYTAIDSEAAKAKTKQYCTVFLAVLFSNDIANVLCREIGIQIDFLSLILRNAVTNIVGSCKFVWRSADVTYLFCGDTNDNKHPSKNISVICEGMIKLIDGAFKSKLAKKCASGSKVPEYSNKEYLMKLTPDNVITAAEILFVQDGLIDEQNRSG